MIVEIEYESYEVDMNMKLTQLSLTIKWYVVSAYW